MKSAVETLGPTRAKLTVEVPFEELKPSLDKAYRTIAQQINVPGFRKGKVPPMVIDRQVGRGAVLEQAINEVVPQMYVEALQSHDLQPLAQPDIEVIRMDDNEALEFTAEVDVRPEITVPDYSGLAAEVDDTEVGRRRRAGADRGAPRAVRDPRRRRPPGRRRRLRRDRPAGHQGRRGGRGRRGQRDVLPRRPRRHARGSRRGAGRHERRRRQDLHLPAGRWRPGRRARRRTGDGLPGAGAGAPGVRRRVRPGGLRVRHRRRADRRRPGASRQRQAPRAGGRRPRRRPGEAARARRGTAARGSRRRRAQRAPTGGRAAAGVRRHHPRQVPRGRGSDRRRSSRPTSSAGCATRSPPSSCSTTSPAHSSSGSTRTS